VKVACVQAEPVILDREATVDKLVGLAAEAAGEGASLLVFPEAFIPVYPSSTWAKALVCEQTCSVSRSGPREWARSLSGCFVVGE
jgi:predicted amidohydrolase